VLAELSQAGLNTRRAPPSFPNQESDLMSAAAIPQLSHEEILGLNVPLESIFRAVERAFVEHGKGNIEMPPKIGVHTRPGTFIHAMPAYIPALGVCGMKWVSGYPGNAARQLPTIAGLVVLNDPENGLPYALLDAQWITAIRTAVVSALIVRCCPPVQSRCLGLAGCGVQGRFHLRCLLHVLPATQQVRLYDVREESARGLRDEASGYSRAAVEIVAGPEACLRGADVAATCTSGRLEVEDDWLPAGATAVAVDSHVAWGRLFGKVKLIMDDEQQARQFEKLGKYPGGLPPVHAELGQILTGAKPGRENNTERFLGLPLGLAIADLAVAQLVWRSYVGARLGDNY
jgi:ornithine cyclodeaminase/alanine dehydrogenase-like protein (mu-crystallin family)